MLPKKSNFFHLYIHVKETKMKTKIIKTNHLNMRCTPQKMKQAHDFLRTYGQLDYSKIYTNK